ESEVHEACLPHGKRTGQPSARVVPQPGYALRLRNDGRNQIRISVRRRVTVMTPDPVRIRPSAVAARAPTGAPVNGSGLVTFSPLTCVVGLVVFSPSTE